MFNNCWIHFCELLLHIKSSNENVLHKHLQHVCHIYALYNYLQDEGIIVITSYVSLNRLVNLLIAHIVYLCSNNCIKWLSKYFNWFDHICGLRNGLIAVSCCHSFNSPVSMNRYFFVIIIGMRTDQFHFLEA